MSSLRVTCTLAGVIIAVAQLSEICVKTCSTPAPVHQTAGYYAVAVYSYVARGL